MRCRSFLNTIEPRDTQCPEGQVKSQTKKRLRSVDPSAISYNFVKTGSHLQARAGDIIRLDGAATELLPVHCYPHPKGETLVYEVMAVGGDVDDVE